MEGGLSQIRSHMIMTDSFTDYHDIIITMSPSSDLDSSHMDYSQISDYTRIQMPEEVIEAGLLAKCPLPLYKNYKFGSCDHNGGVLTSKDSDLKLTIPKGAIGHGNYITFCIVTDLYGPFVIPSKCPTDVVSPYYWIGVTESYPFQKSVQVEFEHYAVVTACDPSHYQLLYCEDNDESYTMQPADYDLSFKVEDDISWCSFKTYHFCSMCLHHGCKDPKISRVVAIFLKTKNFQYLNCFTAEIWFSFPISHCIKRNKELYTNEDMILDQKSSYTFEISCDKKSRSYFTLLYDQDVNGWSLTHSRSTRIYSKNINFYNCYNNMEELQANEKISQSPQRFIVNVKKKSECNKDLDTRILVASQHDGQTIEEIPFELFVSISLPVAETTSTPKSKKPLVLIPKHQCNENIPDLKDLMDYSVKISTCWKEIALHLNISKNKISVIEVNNPSDVKNKCYEMFNTWLQLNIFPCWCHLAKALDAVGQHSVAEEVTKHLKQHSNSMNVAASSIPSNTLVENEDAHTHTQTQNEDVHHHTPTQNEDAHTHTQTQNEDVHRHTPTQNEDAHTHTQTQNEDVHRHTPTQNEDAHTHTQTQTPFDSQCRIL